LPDHAAHINVKVVPEYLTSEHRHIWRLHLELDPTSTISVIYVAIGNAEHQTTGSRTLNVSRSVEFQLAPPTRDPYWVYFEWKTARGEWQTDKQELRLLDEPKGVE
jgi:hypothetical protein